eukprot:278479_1
MAPDFDSLKICALGPSFEESFTHNINESGTDFPSTDNHAKMWANATDGQLASAFECLRQKKAAYRKGWLSLPGFSPPESKSLPRSALIRALLKKWFKQRILPHQALSVDHKQLGLQIAYLFPFFNKKQARQLFRTFTLFYPNDASHSTMEFAMTITGMMCQWLPDEIPIIVEAFCESVMDPDLFAYQHFTVLALSYWYNNVWSQKVPLFKAHPPWVEYAWINLQAALLQLSYLFEIRAGMDNYLEIRALDDINKKAVHLICVGLRGLQARRCMVDVEHATEIGLFSITNDYECGNNYVAFKHYFGHPINVRDSNVELTRQALLLRANIAERYSPKKEMFEAEIQRVQKMVVEGERLSRENVGRPGQISEPSPQTAWPPMVSFPLMPLHVPPFQMMSPPAVYQQYLMMSSPSQMLPSQLVSPQVIPSQIAPSQMSSSPLIVQSEKISLPVDSPQIAQLPVNLPSQLVSPQVIPSLIAPSQMLPSQLVSPQVIPSQIAPSQMSSSPLIVQSEKISLPVDSPQIAQLPVNLPHSTSLQVKSTQTASPPIDLHQTVSFQMDPPQMSSSQVSSPQIVPPPQTVSTRIGQPQTILPLYPTVEQLRMISHPATPLQMASPATVSPHTTTPPTATPQVVSPQIVPPQTVSPPITPPQMTSPPITPPQMTSPPITPPQMSLPLYPTEKQLQMISNPVAVPPQIASYPVVHSHTTTSPTATPQTTSPQVVSPQIVPPQMTSPPITPPQTALPLYPTEKQLQMISHSAQIASYPVVHSPMLSGQVISSPLVSHSMMVSHVGSQTVVAPSMVMNLSANDQLQIAKAESQVDFAKLVESFAIEIDRNGFEAVSNRGASKFVRWFALRQCEWCACTVQRARSRLCAACCNRSYCSEYCRKQHWVAGHEMACGKDDIWKFSAHQNDQIPTFNFSWSGYTEPVQRESKMIWRRKSI